ncbi:hypothetical protein ABB37_09272 [Leptomonas pyrrhocoris]|uniref:Polycystin cation channel PKD1/PKD2 domain-containing protein n=1 Tax=Leptomonas pyrrhocoris TaxID=157538 RepID=A0A0M9FR61_LEPPY|nr:hypothetical protein ABB37_09272 [Leptomonas pyrrhocoris]XP_015652708.1 hypothetical protein ABB37_09272 [Leptomonas pyrrhocoris]KPA74268.1 hypothetical protein ABB37_09272 [Leptomonas pyrrhocoris]KPA74269.1 hypothetical protein ABB37_09272 [Leptomonas pyrrhocoris]|eukprot:XP_015652707.1 hypothetical protein ABB37_09272 [Leptomonas pyrrhocoris]
MPTPVPSAESAASTPPRSSSAFSSFSSMSCHGLHGSVANPAEAGTTLPSRSAYPFTQPRTPLPPREASEETDTARHTNIASPTSPATPTRPLQWVTATPPLHPAPSSAPPPSPAAPSDTPLLFFSPVSVDERPSQGRHRRHPSWAEGATSATGGAARGDALGTASPSSPPRRASVTRRDNAPARARTPRGRLPRQPEEEEELTQLARSLRSEIVGEPFLLTTAFSPVSRGPGSGSRASSALSSTSAAGSAGDGAGGGAGRRPSVPRQGAEGTHSGLATSAASGVPPTLLTPSSSPWGSPLQATKESSMSASGRWLTGPPLPLSPGSRGAGAGGREERSQGRAQVADGHAGSGTESSTEAAQRPPHTAEEEGPPQTSPTPHSSGVDGNNDAVRDGYVDGLHSEAELRQRLLTEDFFSSPFRKLRRDGIVPWKLITSVVLCVLLLLQVMWYQLPLARANASMCRAITEQFMGEDFESKGHGDIVAAPTAWMEGLYASVEHYVEVYYNLSNTSSSDMNYYAAPPVYDNGSTAVVIPPLWPEARNRSTAVRESAVATTATTAPPSQLPRSFSSIAPVRMRVSVDAFSRREGVRHVDASSTSPLAALLQARQLPWSSAAPLSAAGRSGEDEVESSETRWLTFFVDAAHPLGPFAKYRDAARRLRKAGKRQQQRERQRRRRQAQAGDGLDNGASPVKRTGELGPNSTEDVLPSAGEVDAALAMVCRPRLDGLSGRYYRPCASVPSTFSTAAPRTAEEDASPPPPSSSPSSFFTEFSLMDNVRAIHLAVTLRHETGDGSHTDLPQPTGAPAEASGGAESSRGLPRLQGVTGRAATAESAVFQWQVEKAIQVRPGGLVETRLHVQTRIWPKGSSVRQRWAPSHGMAALLGVLAVFELILRGRALWRIKRYKDGLRKERLAFHSRQMWLQRDGLPRRHGAAGGGEAATARDGQATCAGRRVTATAPIPYEWGFPGTPAVPCLPAGAEAAAATSSLSLPEPARTKYGTIALTSAVEEASGSPHSARGAGNGEGGSDGARGTAQPPLFAADAAGALSAYSESTPLLMRDTSLGIIAASHFAATVSAGDAARSVRDAAEEGEAEVRVSPALDTAAAAVMHTPTATWLDSQLRRALPRSVSRVQPARQHVATPIAAKTSKNSLGEWMRSPRVGSPTTAGVARGSVRTPLLGLSPLTPQLSEQIMERSYVDLRTTWRHHLQQTMGTGWHWIGVIAAVLTLSYSALLLLPLLPHAEVAQDGRYDALTSVLLGTAALTSCMLLLSYLRFFPTLYFPILASTYVLPKLFLFALCVSPLFFGFAVFFKVAFGPYSAGHFDSLGWASMGLYLMTYGDSLLDTVDVIADTPYAVTAFFASVMVVTFVLLFMMIMLNIAMSITQHEWLQLRRRFGAALSSSNLLFFVRSREQVKTEAVEAVRTNLEVLWFMLAEEEEEEGEERAHNAREQPPYAVSASGAESESSAGLASSSSPDERGKKEQDGKPDRRRGAHDPRRHRGDTGDTPKDSVDDDNTEGNSTRGSAVGRGVPGDKSSYDVSAATTVPPD